MPALVFFIPPTYILFVFRMKSSTLEPTSSVDCVNVRKAPFPYLLQWFSQCEALFSLSFSWKFISAFSFSFFFFCKSTPWGETVGHAYLNLWTMLSSRYSRWHFARLCSNDVEEWEKDKMSTLWTLRITSGLWQVLQLTLIYSYLSIFSFFLIVTS